MDGEEAWLLGIFSMLCCCITVWPRITTKVLSYGRPPNSEWIVDAFQLMGCAGLFVVAIRGGLALIHFG